MSIYCVPSTLWGARDIVVNKTDKSCPWAADIFRYCIKGHWFICICALVSCVEGREGGRSDLRGQGWSPARVDRWDRRVPTGI